MRLFEKQKAKHTTVTTHEIVLPVPDHVLVFQ